MRWFCTVCLLAAVAHAQFHDPDTPDATIPDASVGQGGADRSSEESETAAACLSSADCDHGLACRAGRCVYQKYREATYAGCAVSPVSAVLLAPACLVALRRRQRRLNLTK